MKPTTERDFEVAMDIVDYMIRHQRVPEIIAVCQKERPHIVGWETFQIHIPKDETLLSTTSPFKGLHPYTEADDAQFYGREKEIAQLQAHLQSQPFLAVIGPSGVGKSSLVHAGLIPALRQSEPSPNPSPWLIHTLTLGDDNPIKVLSDNLTQDIASDTARNTLMDELLSDPRSFDLQATKLLGRQEGGVDGRFLLVVDQLERLFVSEPDHEEQQIWQKAFIDNLMVAISPEGSGQVTVIILLRADFYHQCSQYPTLQQQVVQHQQYISDMPQAELERMMLTLTKNGGWSFESGLVKQILRHLTTQNHNAPQSHLPQLSYALHQTWLKREERQLTFAAYRESGNVSGVIARTADTVLQSELSPTQQQIAQKIFLNLVERTTEGKLLARQITWTNLKKIDENADEIETVVEIFVKSGLIRDINDPLMLTHETIITHWPRLQQWLDDAQDGKQIQQRLSEATDKWIADNQHARTLLQGLALQEARNWATLYGDQLIEREKSFLDKSEQAASRQQSLVRAALIGGGLIALLLIVGFFLNARTADNQAEAAQTAAVATATAAHFAVGTIETHSTRSANTSGQEITALQGQVTAVVETLTAVAHTPTPTPTGILVDQYEAENNQTPRAITAGRGLCDISLYPENDTDRFVFSGKEGSSYTIGTENQGPASQDLDTFMTIYDRDNNPLGANDDIIPSERWSEVTFTAAKDSLYFIEITNLAQVDTANKPYCLYVEEYFYTPTPTPFIPGNIDQAEPNDSFADAFLFGEGDLLKFDELLNFFPNETALITGDYDVDFFVFRVQAGGVYRCQTFNLDTINDTEMILYKEDRETIIGQSDDIKPGDFSSFVEFVSDYKGEVYIYIEPFFKPKHEEAFRYTYDLDCYSVGLPTLTPTPVFIPTILTPTPTP